MAVAIDKAQSDSTGLTDACKIFMDLLAEPLLDHHKARLQHRFQQAIKPCHLVAYTLHPAYQGEGLTAEHQEVVTDWFA